jgi:hypothetical protein
LAGAQVARARLPWVLTQLHLAANFRFSHESSRVNGMCQKPLCLTSAGVAQAIALRGQGAGFL